MGKQYFRGQKYRNLKAECIKKKNLFVDIEFPPTNDSLFLGPVNPEFEIEWKRPAVSSILHIFKHLKLLDPIQNLFPGNCPALPRDLPLLLDIFSDIVMCCNQLVLKNQPTFRIA